jgi:PBP4 family serine-type D-alanyl-D-alanine carboxypeptidase
MVNGKIVLMRDDSSRALQMLHQAIEKLLGDKTLTKTDYAAQVVSLRNGRELYAHNATTPLIPASTTKLLPTFGALEQFGTEYLVRTNVYTDATGEIVDGVLRGNVYLVGHGDPLLSVTDLEHLAVQLHNAGIKRITGNVYGDDSFFDRMMSRVEYSGDDDEVQPTGPVSALTVQKNLITIMVSAGPTQGGAVRVQTLPATDAFTFDVKAVVKATKPVRVRRRWVKPTLIISEAGTSKNGKQHFVITGTLNPNTTVSKLFFIQHPAFAAADIFRKRLELFSIKIDGATGLQKTPNAAAMIAEFVRPLTEILKIVNKKSDNFCAEHLFKMLGSPLVSGEKTSVFSETSEQRSAQASVKQLQSILHDHGIPPTLWTINDGSGLSRRNKIAPAMFTRLLDEADRASFRETFLSSLAVAGLDGTLEHRMRGTSAEYNVTAKTGTHKNVSSLAGYVRTKDGERVVFSFMFNGWGVWKYKQVENKLCEVLANFSYSEAAFADSLAVNEQ